MDEEILKKHIGVLSQIPAFDDAGCMDLMNFFYIMHADYVRSCFIKSMIDRRI